MDVRNAARRSKRVQMGLLLTVVKMARASWVEENMVAQESQSLFLENWDSDQTALPRIHDGSSFESDVGVNITKLQLVRFILCRILK